MTKVELDGKEYTVRRLGLSDIFTLNDILTSVMSGAQIRGLDFSDLASTGLGNGDLGSKMVSAVLLGLPFAKEEITDWLLSLVPDYEGTDIYGTDLMPFVEAISEHKDIASFLSQGVVLLPKILKKVTGNLTKETQAA